MGRLLDFLGIETRAGSVGSAGGDSPLPGVVPPSRAALADVSVATALTIPSVYRAFSILSTAVSQLDLGVWRSGQQIETPAVIRRPDVDQSLSQFLKRTVIGLAASGNAFWKITKNADGSVANVQALNPLGVAISYDDQGRKVYDVADAFARPQRLTSRQVSHLRLLEVPGYVYGLGPVQAARSALSGALKMRDYSDNWFDAAGVPTGVLTTAMQLTPDQADAAQRRWHETQKARSVAVLGQGMTYDPVVLSPADAQWLESQQFAITDVARLFGIPAAYLLAQVEGSSMTYQNLEMADTQFLRYTLLQYLKEIEDALSDLLVRGQTVQFNVDGLLRPDAKTQAEIHATYVAMGALSVEEVRAQKGWTGPPPPAPAQPAIPATAEEAPADV